MILSDVQKANIRKQVDFYFSDSNLPFDKFLFEQVTQAEDGWMDLSVVVAFKRMQQILKKDAKSPDDVDSKDIEAVAAIMQGSEIVEISEDGFQIRRKNMPTDWDAVKAAVAARSLHVAPLPVGETIESIGTFFTSFGEVRQVRLQRIADPSNKAGVFAGSAIVEMATQEAADALLAKEVVYEGAPLRIQTKTAFQEQLAEAGVTEGLPARAIGGDFPVITAEGLPLDKDEGKRDTPEPEAKAEEPLVPGVFVKFTVQGDVPVQMPVGKELKELLGKTGGLAFVSFDKMKGPTGQMRFNAKEHADACLAQCDAETGLCSLELSPAEDGNDAVLLSLKLEQLTGDDERDAWAGYQKDIAARNARDAAGPSRGRGGGRGRGRGFRGGGGGRANKRQRT